MLNSKIICVATLALTLGGFTVSAQAETAQTKLHIEKARQDACLGSDDGDSCSYHMPDGEDVNGFCKRSSPDQLKPICEPIR